MQFLFAGNQWPYARASNIFWALISHVLSLNDELCCACHPTNQSVAIRVHTVLKRAHSILALGPYWLLCADWKEDEQLWQSDLRWKAWRVVWYFAKRTRPPLRSIQSFLFYSTNLLSSFLCRMCFAPKQSDFDQDISSTETAHDSAELAACQQKDARSNFHINLAKGTRRFEPWPEQIDYEKGYWVRISWNKKRCEWQKI